MPELATTGQVRKKVPERYAAVAMIATSSQAVPAGDDHAGRETWGDR